MSGAPAVESGLLIAQRYRLESLIPDRSIEPIVGRSASRVGQLWKARDDILARTVAVLVVEQGDPLAARVLAGARAVASLTSSAMAKVYDAGEADGMAYVVLEYFGGGSLEQQLRGGPMEPAAAVDLVVGVANAVADAHDIGLYGMTPTPNKVLFTSSGVPRLAGVALAGEPPDGAAEFDTVALAHLLYAALTGRWPGEDGVSALLPAPYTEGHLCTPRQVRGGVPREADLIVAQALGSDLARRGLPPIATPRAFANALAPLRSIVEDGHPYTSDTAPLPTVGAPSGPRRRRWWPARRGARYGVAAGIVVLGVAIAGLALPGRTIYPHFITHLITKPTETPTPTVTSAKPTAIPPKSIVEFDPFGNHDDPHVVEAPNAIDGNPATAWHTQTFASAALGNLKPGVGLLVDLGEVRDVGQVQLRLLGSGTTLTLFESSGPRPPSTPQNMRPVAAATAAGEDVTLKLPTATSGRYWLIWITSLPPGNGGYAGGVADASFFT